MVNYELGSDLKINDWRKFQSLVSPGNFYQSFQWAKLHQLKQGKFFLWYKKQNDNIKSGAIILKYNLPFKQNYLYTPLGPIGNLQKEDFNDFLSFIIQVAKKERSIFARFYLSPDFYPLLFNIKKSPPDYFLSAGNIPSTNAQINLEKEESEILKAMHPKTRYNIGLAQKKGVIIKNFRKDIINEFEIFFELLKNTASKKEFALHPKSHYQALIDNFKDNLVLFIAYYNQKPIAGALTLKWDDKAYYLHGGTNFSYSNLMAPHLLHFEIIKFYKKAGLKFYDLGAASSKENAVKKWEGISRFKLSFGATLYNLPPAYDLIINPLFYFLYNFARKFY